MKKAIFAVLLLLATTGRAGAQVDSCLKFEFPDHYYDTLYHETYENQDSVMVDSCSDSPTYLEYYATKGWSMDFKYSVIKRQPAPYDTSIELPWTAIDTAYIALRAAFAALETRYGTFNLGEVRPDSYDSTTPGNRSYALLFDNYVCVDSVVAALELFPDLDTTDGFPDAGFGGYPAWADGGLGSVAVHSMKNEGLRIYPNPSTELLTVTRLDSIGIYNLKCFDVLGRKILDIQADGNSELSLDVHSLANGVYVLVCDNEVQSNLIVAH